MRNPAELVAMLAAHGIDLGHVPGGVPDLVALDVAGTMGMMHDQAASALLMGKFALDLQATLAYREHWRMTVDRQAYRERWGDDPRTGRLAAYAFSEWLDSQRCRSCKGTEHDMTPDGKVVACEACDGTGLRKIGDRPVARALGMSNEGYRRSPWRERMQWARAELARREAAALDALAHRLTGRHRGP